MKVHVLQHAPFEGLGCIATWLTTKKVEVSTTRFFEQPILPPQHGFDLLVIMGGPMSANDEAALPWLREEKRFIREAVKNGVAVLGICLGSQLIASALGARVYRNAQKEIGWFPIEAVPVSSDVFHFPSSLTVFQWHGETFDLPIDAVHLARSAACENQAFQVGRRTLGLQFHLETSPKSVRSFLENCRAELSPAPYIQTEAEIANPPAAAYTETNAWMVRVLNYLIEK
jgi:GMP synthase-like glutamine amidotransferase